MGKSNKPKKLKKQRRQMSPQAKRNLINVFKSIISNQSCVDGGKEAPWWIAAIFLVLSICLPVIPITVSYSQAYGSSFISSYNYGADRGVEKTFESLKADGYTFNITGGTLSFNKPVSTEPVATDIIHDSSRNTTENPDYQYYNFMVYITDKTGSELTTFINVLDTTQYEVGTLNKYDETKQAQYDEKGTKFYTPSFIVFTPSTMGMAVYKSEDTTRAGSSYGGLNWNNTAEGDLITQVLTVDNTLVGAAKTKAVFNNWKSVLNETYIAQKNETTLKMSLIYLGVYTGLIVFLGLMIFVLTRGKNSVYRYLNVWVCQKIAWWAAFTPAILGMILGFLMATNMIGQMAFIVLLSLRIMWMSMRQLRPVQ